MTGQPLPQSRYWQFPNLTNSNHSVQSPPTDNYNCIAWAYGVSDKWMWPEEQDAYWPSESIEADTLETVVRLFLDIGFNKCDSSRLEQGYIKIAIYVKEKEPKHAAFQLESGRWSSKLGKKEDIEHNTLGVLEGPLYGRATVFLKKRCN